MVSGYRIKKGQPGTARLDRMTVWRHVLPAQTARMFEGVVSCMDFNISSSSATGILAALGVINSIWASPLSATTTFKHIVLVLEENKNYDRVIGNHSAPYLNSLASEYGLSTNYYANTHPSIGNYFWLTTGQELTNDDNQTPSSFPVSVDNVVRRLTGSGVSWKAYAECMPNVGYTGGDTTCPNGDNYYVRHVPLEYMTDVQNDPTQRNNLVPFEDPDVGFGHDVVNNTLPAYSFVTPDGCHDAHDCSISVADNWLQQNIGPLINDAIVMQNTLVIIVFDEAGSDNLNGGGRVYWVAVGPWVNPGYISTTFYQHQSTLRETLEGLGLSFDLGAAVTAPSMGEFFISVFGIGARIVTTTNASALRRPILHGELLCTEAAGLPGTISGGPKDRPKSTWWYVAYDDGCAGWTIEDSLSLE